MKLNFQYLIAFNLAALSLISPAETLVDSNRIIQGNLEIHSDDTVAESGKFLNDGIARLAQGINQMPNILSADQLTKAEYYGPVAIGPRSKRVEYVFEKNGNQFTGLPLLYAGRGGRIKITATISDSLHTESASWELDGSRHRALKALDHKAYGLGRYFKLRGSMAHGQSLLYLDYASPSSSTKAHTVYVSVEIAASKWYSNTPDIGLIFDRLEGPLNNGNVISDVEIVSSSVYEKYSDGDQLGRAKSIRGTWDGTHYDFLGSVNVNGSPVLTRASGGTASATGFAGGTGVTASGLDSIAYGYQAIASGNHSSAFGNTSIAAGHSSFAAGHSNVAKGNYSGAVGIGLKADGQSEFVIGQFNEPSGNSPTSDPDLLLVVGNGASSSEPSNALEVRANGSTKVSGDLVVGGTIIIERQGDISMGIFGE